MTEYQTIARRNMMDDNHLGPAQSTRSKSSVKKNGDLEVISSVKKLYPKLKPSDHINTKCPNNYPKNCTDPIWPDYWIEPTDIERVNPCVERDIPCLNSLDRLRANRRFENILSYPCVYKSEGNTGEDEGEDCQFPLWDESSNLIKRILETKKKTERINPKRKSPYGEFYSNDVDSLDKSLYNHTSNGGKQSMKKKNKRRVSKKL
jgi:hypothetical protein